MDFIKDLPDDDVQPVEAYINSKYLVIRQWDASGDQEHVVCIPKNSVVLGELVGLINYIRPKAT